MADVSATGVTQATGFTNMQVMGEGGMGIFLGHKVRFITEDGFNAMQTLQGNCQLCGTLIPRFPPGSETREPEGPAISIINVKSIFHQFCLNNATTHTTGASQEQLDEIRGKATAYGSIGQLREQIQGKCVLCGIGGSMEKLSKNGCTNPSFFIRYETILALWLEERFKKAGFTNIKIELGAIDANTCTINVTAFDQTVGSQERKYSYSSKDIVQGTYDVKCIKNLQKAVNSELTARDLFISYPHAFNLSTCLFIEGYNVLENILSLSHNGQTRHISFESLVDNEGNFNEPAFRNALKVAGFNLEDLLGNIPVKTGNSAPEINPGHSGLSDSGFDEIG